MSKTKYHESHYVTVLDNPPLSLKGSKTAPKQDNHGTLARASHLVQNYEQCHQPALSHVRWYSDQ